MQAGCDHATVDGFDMRTTAPTSKQYPFARLSPVTVVVVVPPVPLMSWTELTLPGVDRCTARGYWPPGGTCHLSTAEVPLSIAFRSAGLAAFSSDAGTGGIAGAPLLLP